MLQTKIIQVLVLDASIPFRNVVQQAVGRDTSLHILPETGAGCSLEQAVQRSSPDVIILSEESAGGAGNLGKRLERLRPSDLTAFAPCIVIGPGAPGTVQTIGEHDAEFVQLPKMNSSTGAASFGNEVCTKVKLAASAAAVMRLTASNAVRAAAMRQGTQVSAPVPSYQQPNSTSNPSITALRPSMPHIAGVSGHYRYNIIAIGASTGGTEATAQILENLPADMPGIVITQHMPPDFTRMYADRLDRICKLSVSEAKDGVRICPGTAVVAAGGLHMYLKKDSQGYYVHCAPGEKVNGHCPSVGVLFDSVAQCAGRDAVGVILTGMGQDGAEELLHLRQAGAFTVGQDQKTCVVYGMPMVAYNIGAVMQQAPLEQIADILIKRVHLC